MEPLVKTQAFIEVLGMMRSIASVSKSYPSNWGLGLTNVDWTRCLMSFADATLFKVGMWVACHDRETMRCFQSFCLSSQCSCLGF